MPLRSFSQAETVLTERRRLERPLLAMVWLGAAALSMVEQSALYLLAATVAVVVNMLAVRRNREIYLRHALINVAVVLASVVLLAELFLGNKDIKLALGHYLILIQLCKLFERKTNRDYVQLLILSSLVMIVGALMCSDLWFAVVLVVYLVLVCYATMVFTLKRGLDVAAHAALTAEDGPVAPHQVAWNVTRRWPGRTLGRYVAISLTGMLIVGAILFLVAPRSGLWAQMSGDLGDSATSPPKLGRAVNLRPGIQGIMEVTRSGGAVSPYMRGRVYYGYSDSRWHSAARPDATNPERPNSRLIDTLGGIPADAPVQEITLLRASLLPRIFVPPHAASVTSSGAEVMAFDGIYRLPRADARGGREVSYTVRVWPARLHGMAQDGWLPETERLADVEIHPRVRALARTWCADLLDKSPPGGVMSDETARRIAEHLTNRLREHCTYTLDLTDASGSRDGVEDFLFHLKRGHCVYFASALTVMCRSLGVRARYVDGFRVDNPKDARTFTVRQKDGHAWTEVYFRSGGWAVFDATPAGAGADAGAELGWIGRAWAAMKLYWQENVLEYDLASRKQIAKAMRDAWTAFTRALAAAVDTLKMSLIKLLVRGRVDRVLFHLAVGICLLGLAIEVVLVVRVFRRRGRHRHLVEIGQAIPPKQFDFARRLFALFEKHALKWHHDLTPRQWSRRAADQLHLPTGDVDRLVSLYYRLRWGHMPADSDELARANDTVDLFARQLAD